LQGRDMKIEELNVEYDKLQKIYGNYFIKLDY